MRWAWLSVLVGVSLASPAWAQEEAPPPDQRMAPVVAEPPDELADESDGQPTEESGVDMVLPVFRLAFGTSRSVEPSSLRGFAFDIVLGSRLAFQPLGGGERPERERWRPALTGELGYSRRAGDFGTHDLTLGLGLGFQRMTVGLHLIETVTFPVDGSGRFGARTSARVDVFLGLLHFELGHEAGFTNGSVTHDLRGVIGVDVGLLISLLVFSGKLMS